MRIKPKFARLFGLTAVAALLAMAVWVSAAGASAFRTQSGSFPVEFLGESLGESKFLSEKLNLVVCHNSHSKGAVTGTTLVKVTITYLTSCELDAVSPLNFKESCPTITTNELLLTPLSNLNPGATTKLGLLVLPKSGTLLAEFTCSGSNKTKVEVSGAVICESTPGGKLVTQDKVICKAGATHGSQEFTSGEGPTGGTLGGTLTATSTLGIFKVAEKDSQETTEDITYKEPVELTEKGFKLGLLKASEQPVKFLGIGVLEKEHFDYETFPVGGPESEEAKLGTTTIEEKTLAGKIGKWEIKKNECEGKTLKPGLSCLIEVEFKGEAESMEVLEEPKKVCGRLVQPYTGVVSGRSSQAVAKLNCEM